MYVLITGAAGTVKSWQESVLGRQACMNGCKMTYHNLYLLFEEVSLTRISSILHLFFV